MTDWQLVQGSQNAQPSEWDTTSSATTVYQRRNIQQVSSQIQGKNITVWQYEQRTMTPEEYFLLSAQNVIDSIPPDYSALSSNVSALISSAPSLNESWAVEIPNGSDFNDYTTPGTFFVREQFTPNFAHSPGLNVDGRLYVVQPVNYNGVIQIFLPETEKSRIFTRYLNADTYPGSWGAWEKTALVSDLEALNLEEIDTWTDHYYVKNTGDTVDLANPTHTSANVRYLVANCSAGDQFRITASGGSSYRPYSFQDASSNVLSVAANAPLTDEVVTAPMGSATLLVNDNTMEGSVFKGKFYDPNLLSLKNKYYIDLASGTDLNNITQPGNYLSGRSGITNTLIHCPVTGTGFILKHFETTTSGASTRFFQMIIVNTTEPQIWVRSNVGSWGDWTRLCTTNDTILPSNIHLTSSNYLTYFPNGSFNDAPINSIVGIGDNVPLTDGPDGDEWIGYGSHTSTGYISGTLLTFRPNSTNTTAYRGISQILIGYRTTDFSPTFSYRIAVVGSNGLEWSAWSKFEQNGYLRAGNRVISAGRMSESVADLDNMPLNVMWQIDKNCTGETPESTLGHHPFPGVSCVAVNMAFSYSSRHGQVQTVYALDGRVAWRYGYQNDVNDYRWKPWTYYATYIPTAPTTDGTYTLQCTVSNGTASYAWVGVT